MKKEPPESGIKPMRTKPGVKLAESAAMRMSQSAASDSPAPAAAPLTAASTGFSSARIPSATGW